MKTNFEYEKGIKKLAARGLNLFAATQLKNLPEDILDLLKKDNIIFDPDDTICLIGHGGNTLWKNLSHPLNEHTHPIDNFSIEQMKLFAKEILQSEIQILFPHEKHVIPLQRLARFMNLSRASHLGLDISREYGVWFAFRGAFIVKNHKLEVAHESFISPCETCSDRPCLTACPVQAPAPVFRLETCATYRLSKNSSCSDRCHARLACPYKSEHRYDIEQINYHMTRTAHLSRLSNYSKK
jgi:hypothetical protein